ncbi:MAG: hypothetical protein HFH34_09295 [Eubacterium sp.]|nr:hypothetical protein [Eubacterium sp.]
MKNAMELYTYCKMNMHTRNWMEKIKSNVISCLKDEVPRCIGNYYNTRRIEYDYISELQLILEVKCREEVQREDVFIVVNMIFKDIADEVTKGFPFENPYKIVLYAKNNHEAVLWLGPSPFAELFLKAYIVL